MSLFKPTPRPRDPGIAPFIIGDRVVVSPGVIDAAFIGGSHGTVMDVQYLPEDSWGPWIVSVRLDTMFRIQCGASELTHEPPEPPQPHDDEHTPIYDDVVEEAKARDGLAAEVETFLANVAGGAA